MVLRLLFFVVALTFAACEPRAELIADGTPAYGHAVKRAEDVVILERRPTQPYRVVAHLAWRQFLWEDAEVSHALREEAGKAGCDAVVMPRERGQWAECLVLEPVTARTAN